MSKPIQFNIIGAGRLGKTLSFALVNAKIGQINAIYNQDYQKAQWAVAEIGAGKPIKTLDELPVAHFHFITTSDDAIIEIVDHLVASKAPLAGSIVVHCSGALSSQELAPLKTRGCQIATMHPAKSFSGQLPAWDAFKDCLVVIEGDEKATEALASVLQSLNAIIIPIQPSQKIVYHAAAVMASNYLACLAASSMQLFRQAEIPENLIKPMVLTLMQSSLDNIKKTTDLSKALTGPLTRGDLNTIKAHLNVIDDELIKTLYSAAAKASLPLTPLPDELKRSLDSLFKTHLD